MARLKSPKVTFFIDNPNSEENTEKIATYLILKAMINPASDIIEKYVKDDAKEYAKEYARDSAGFPA